MRGDQQMQMPRPRDSHARKGEPERHARFAAEEAAPEGLKPRQCAKPGARHRKGEQCELNEARNEDGHHQKQAGTLLADIGCNEQCRHHADEEKVEHHRDQRGDGIALDRIQQGGIKRQKQREAHEGEGDAPKQNGLLEEKGVLAEAMREKAHERLHEKLGQQHEQNGDNRKQRQSILGEFPRAGGPPCCSSRAIRGTMAAWSPPSLIIRRTRLGSRRPRHRPPQRRPCRATQPPAHRAQTLTRESSVASRRR